MVNIVLRPGVAEGAAQSPSHQITVLQQLIKIHDDDGSNDDDNNNHNNNNAEAITKQENTVVLQDYQ